MDFDKWNCLSGSDIFRLCLQSKCCTESGYERDVFTRFNRATLWLFTPKSPINPLDRNERRFSVSLCVGKDPSDGIWRDSWNKTWITRRSFIYYGQRIAKIDRKVHTRNTLVSHFATDSFPTPAILVGNGSFAAESTRHQNADSSVSRWSPCRTGPILVAIPRTHSSPPTSAVSKSPPAQSCLSGWITWKLAAGGGRTRGGSVSAPLRYLHR